MPELQRILQEIQARSIWKVLGVYALSSWLTLLVIQVLTTVAGLPSWFPDLALGFLVMALPPVLALAWLRDGSGTAEPPHGPEDTGRAADLPLTSASRKTNSQPGASGESGRTRGPALLPFPGLLALGVGILVLGGLALAWFFVGLPFGWSGEEGTPGPRVAVLPYRSVAFDPGEVATGDRAIGDVATGNDPAGGWDGSSPPQGTESLEALALTLHEDLLLRLATVDGITPFSPRSMIALGKPVHEEPGAGVAGAREAGAHAILSVELARAGDGFHLSARLLNARGRERWNGTFQVEDPPAGLFQAQAELALEVLAFLGLPSDAGDDALMEGMPTQDMDALRLYAWGRTLRRDGGRDGEGPAPEVGEGTLREAERLFLEAVERDPEFALSWSALSETRSLLFRRGASRGDEGATAHLERSWTAANRALRLDPEDPLARLAVGNLLARSDATDSQAPIPGGAGRALHEYRRAAGRLPGWAPLHQAIGELARRTGDWDTALSAWERSAELEPGVARIRFELGLTHNLLRHFPRAIFHLEAALAADPELDMARSVLFHSRLSRWGDLDSARVAFESVPDPGALPLTRFQAHFYGREFGAAGEVALGLASSPSRESGSVRLKAPCTVYTAARMLGMVRAFIGQVEGSRSELTLARDELVADLSRRPHDPGTLAALGEVLALRGDGTEARPFAEGAVDLLSVERDAIEGPACVAALARTRVLVGQTREALDLLEWILAIPGPLSPGELRFDPTWDPLRSNPRFQVLLGPDPEDG